MIPSTSFNSKMYEGVFFESCIFREIVLVPTCIQVLPSKVRDFGWLATFLKKRGREGFFFGDNALASFGCHPLFCVYFARVFSFADMRAMKAFSSGKGNKGVGREKMK